MPKEQLNTKRKASNHSPALQRLQTQSGEWPRGARAFFFLAALAVLPGMVFAPKLFAGMAVAAGVWLVWLARIEALLILLLLYLEPADFFRSVDTLRGGFVDSDANLVTVKIVVLMVACFRIVWEGIQGRDLLVFRGVLRRLYGFWLICIPLALVSSYWGYRNGFENWTRSARFFATAGMFFFGIIVGWRNPQGIRTLRPFFEVVTFALLTLNLFNIFAQHLVFLLVGFGGALGVDAICRGRLLRRGVGVLMLVVAGAVAARGSFTMIAIFLLAVVLTAALIPKAGTGRTARAIALGGILFVPVMIGIAINYGGGYAVAGGNIGSQATVEIQEKLMFKIAGDRGPLWYEALEQIRGGPYVLAPSGRPLMLVDVTSSSESEWVVGAHNALLEVTRNGGLILGAFCIGFLFWQLIQLRSALAALRGTAVIGVAAGLFAVAVVGITTGDFPLDLSVGLWIWGLAGVIVEYSRRLANARSWIADGKG